MTKADPNTHIPSKKPTPQITMIVPGRRALGEDWSEVVIGHNEDGVTVERKDAEAPADGRAIIAMSEDEGHIRDIIEAQLGKARESGVHTFHDMTFDEKVEFWNEAFWDFMEQKLKHLKGQSQIGASGKLVQREKVVQNPATRPYWSRQ